MAQNQTKAQRQKKRTKKHTDTRSIVVRVVAGATALLMIGSVLLSAIL